MERGPVQVVVVGFADEDFAVAILPELRRLRRGTLVRLLDVILVSKEEDGTMTTMAAHESDGDWAQFGETIGALMGFGANGQEGLLVGAGAGAGDGARGVDAGEAWAISDAIPAGTYAAVALIEHSWANPLRDAVARGGGFALEDTWLHPSDLLAVGAVMTDDPVAGDTAGSGG